VQRGAPSLQEAAGGGIGLQTDRSLGQKKWKMNNRDQEWITGRSLQMGQGRADSTFVAHRFTDELA
jgi:hypothetical protein